MSEQNKACPFCAEKAERFKEYGGLTSLPAVRCSDSENCIATVKTTGASQYEADLHWNTRPLEDALQAKINALVAHIYDPETALGEIELVASKAYNRANQIIAGR